MKRLSSVVIFAVACSSSVAQDSIHGVGNPAVLAAPILVATSLSQEIPESEPQVPLRTSVRTSRLEYEWFTKIGVSEGNFDIEEAKRLLETLENMRDMRDDKSLLLAMYAQSAKITRRDPFTDTRQIWVSYLQMQGDGPPAKGWIECTGYDLATKKATPKGCTGTWRATVKLWKAFREQTRELYYSGVVPDTVPGKPIQWGGEMDYWRGVGRGFCPLNIGGRMRNTYWGEPRDPANRDKCLPIDEDLVKSSRVLSAAIARGRNHRKVQIEQMMTQN